MKAPKSPTTCWKCKFCDFRILRLKLGIRINAAHYFKDFNDIYNFSCSSHVEKEFANIHFLKNDYKINYYS